MDMIRDQAGNTRMSYDSWVQGGTIFAIELSKCGQKSGEAGSLDLEMTFGSDGKTGTVMEGSVMLFTEQTESIALQSYIKAHSS